MFGRKLTDDQQAILEAILEKSYKKWPLNTKSGQTYITLNGVQFTWLRGLGDGKDVKIFDSKQPEWFAKLVRKGLSND